MATAGCGAGAAVSQAPDKRDRAAEAVNLARLAAIDARIAEIDQRLKAEFTDYAALIRPEPLSVAEVQSQLRGDEALVLFLDTRRCSRRQKRPSFGLSPRPTCAVYAVRVARRG
jgi:hypothetical protein